MVSQLKKLAFVLRFRLLLILCVFALGNLPHASAQTTTLSKPEVDRMLYVSNAFEVMERRSTPELVAFAFYINATYQGSPNYSPDRLLQELQNARARYYAYYRSALNPNQNRFLMSSYESVASMLCILATLPGEKDTLARHSIAAHAVNFGTLLDPSAYLPETIPSQYNQASLGIFQSSSTLSRGRGQELYLRSRKEQWYKLYDLARSNANVAQVVDGYFSNFFRASVNDAGFAILRANPEFANSTHFLRIAPYFQWDVTKPNYGTFTIDAATLTARVAQCEADALAATQQFSTSLNAAYTLYQRDYAAYSLNATQQQNAAALLQNPLRVFNQQLNGLSGFANIVDLSLPSSGSSGDTQSKISAGLTVVSSLVSLGAGMASPGGAGKLGMMGGVLGLVGSTMGLADAFGLGGSSGPSNQDLADGLNQLNENLKTLSADLAYRINTVDEHLITLYNATKDGFNTVLQSISDVNANLAIVQQQAQILIYNTQSTQAQLYRLSQLIYAFFTAYNVNQRLGLQARLSTLDSLLRNNPAAINYNDDYQYLLNYATLYALSPSEVGDLFPFPSLAPSDGFTPGALAAQLVGSKPEQTVNYLCGYVDVLLKSPPYGLVLPALRGGATLPNEPAWEMCLSGVLRLDISQPEAFVTATRNDGAANDNSHFGMRKKGRSIQQTAANATLQFRNATDGSLPSPRYFPSPVLTTLLTDYSTKATVFTQKLTALKSALPTVRTAIAAGFTHTLMLRSDGTVVACGSNASGELGDGTTTARSLPVLVNGLTRVTAISAGRLNAFSLALRSDGTVWAWGNNSSGQLGDNNGQRTVAAPVNGLTGVTAIAAGGFHCLALKSDGTVWAWGGNFSGQLGNGTNTGSSTPVQVSGLTGVTAIAAGSSHSLARKSDGTVWAWGNNGSGQLGASDGFDHNTPVPVAGLSGVTQIAAGGIHSLALKSGGTVWTWGNNFFGQLGNGTTFQPDNIVQASGLSGIIALDGGQQHSLALKSDGTVWAWGSNVQGQVGDGTTVQRPLPVQLSSITGVTAISAGSFHDVALKSNGATWAWGSNSQGQIGIGSAASSQITPIAMSPQPTSVSRARVQAYIFDIAQRYVTGSGGTQDYATVPAADALNTAYVDLQNAYTVLERMMSLGLSRSLATDTLPRALLYANVTDPFPKIALTGATNPNYGKALTDSQRLPERNGILALYNDLTEPFDPEPNDLMIAALPTRITAFQSYLNTTLQNLATEANARISGTVANQQVLGEPLPDVEMMLRRFDSFTMTKITGTLQASDDARAAGALAKLNQNQLTIQVTLRNLSFAEPLLTFPITPDATGRFTFYAPDAAFDVLFQVPGFLQRKVTSNTVNAPSATITVGLTPGDLSGDNRIDLFDVTLWRKASGSRPHSRNWNPLADLNGDGIVNDTDFAILKGQFGKKGDTF